MKQRSEICLGILETGLVDEKLKLAHGSYPQMFQALFDSLDCPPRYKIYNVIEETYPEHIDECDAYLLTGSKSDSFATEPWIEGLKDYVRLLFSRRKKMLGICFGHQLIAHALGGEAARSSKGWGVGVYKADVKPSLDLPWLNEAKAFSLLVSHRDQVIRLPEGATCLAGNDFCPNSAYVVDDIVLCFQGHPEFDIDYARALMESRRQDIGDATCDKALESYTIHTDHLTIAQWLMDFIDVTCQE